MPRNSWVLLQLVPCLFCLFAAKASAQIDRTDNQQWTDVQLAVPVTKSFDFNVLGTLRLGRDIHRPVDERVGVGFTYRFGKYFSVSPNFLYIGMQPSAGRRIWESRLSLPLQVRFDWGKFRLSDRNLLERRIRNSGLRANRYRNKFQIEHAIGDKDWKLSLFVADEVFYDWFVNRWVRNRISIGVIKVFDKHFTQDIFYLRQNDGVSIPGDLNVIGTSLRVRL